MRPLAAAGLLVLAAAATGCAARPRGAAAIAAAAADARPGSNRPRDGWAHLGPGVTLRNDTPPLDALLPPSAPPVLVSAYGPRGAEGDTSPMWNGPDCGAVYGSLPWSPFLLPGGAILPGLRPPSEIPPGPYAGPYLSTFPASDVATHRPGLSTGSGFWGRQDDPPPTHPHEHAPRR